MQDRYAGDVGDFSKFALMRALIGHTGWRAGLIWYRFPDEAHNKDGRHVGYVTDKRWHACDGELVKLLAPIATGSARSVAALEACGVLPPDTSYFNESIPTGQAARAAWLDRSIVAMEGCQVVMVDPDNGLESATFRYGSGKSGKYITLDEVRQLADAFPCLVIYHHFDRSASHREQVRRQLDRLRSAAPHRHAFAVRYRRISPRAYFVLATSSVEVVVSGAVGSLTASPWNFHFEAV